MWERVAACASVETVDHAFVTGLHVEDGRVAGVSFIDRDGARLIIDGLEVAMTGPPFAQVCGSQGNAIRYDRGSLGLRAGKHTFHLEQLHSASLGAPRLLWEGPALPLAEVPPAAFSHPRQDVVTSDKTLPNN